jgi:hypothetical protein
MSTRCVVARKTASGFEGRFVHWDGYPSGVGATLFNAYRSHFKHNLKEMLKYFIDDHPAGWSELCEVDFSLPVGYVDSMSESCGICGRVYGDHFNFGSNFNGYGANLYVLGHPFQRPHNPKCLCHGDANNPLWTITEETASGSGCEYAYVFETLPDPKRAEGKDLMYVLSSYCGLGPAQGKKMIGYFGVGDEAATWKVIATLDLRRKTKPNWKKISEKG